MRLPCQILSSFLNFLNFNSSTSVWAVSAWWAHIGTSVNSFLVDRVFCYVDKIFLASWYWFRQNYLIGFVIKVLALTVWSLVSSRWDKLFHCALFLLKLYWLDFLKTCLIFWWSFFREVIRSKEFSSNFSFRVFGACHCSRYHPISTCLILAPILLLPQAWCRIIHFVSRLPVLTDSWYLYK